MKFVEQFDRIEQAIASDHPNVRSAVMSDVFIKEIDGLPLDAVIGSVILRTETPIVAIGPCQRIVNTVASIVVPDKRMIEELGLSPSDFQTSTFADEPEAVAKLSVSWQEADTRHSTRAFVGFSRQMLTDADRVWGRYNAMSKPDDLHRPMQLMYTQLTDVGGGNPGADNLDTIDDHNATLRSMVTVLPPAFAHMGSSVVGREIAVTQAPDQFAAMVDYLVS